MRATTGIAALPLTFMLAACASNFPASPEAYRQSAGTNPLLSSGKFEVSTPMASVTASLSKAADVCLNRTVTSTGPYRATAYGTRSFSATRRYSANLTSTPQGATLAIRAKTLQTTGGGHLLSPEPADGYFHAVVDVASSGSGTLVTYYVPTASSGDWVKTIRGWVGGSIVCQEF